MWMISLSLFVFLHSSPKSSLNYLLNFLSLVWGTCLFLIGHCYFSQLPKFLSQPAFAQEILSCANMAMCYPYNTPTNTKTNLIAEGESVSNPNLYRNLTRALQYLTFTSLDIVYVM